MQGPVRSCERAGAAMREADACCTQPRFEDRGGHLPPPGSAARDLLQRLVTYAPGKRLSPADALQHAWFAEAPLPSANALQGPAGERAGPYPRRVAETAARAAKRKAEEAPPPPPARRDSVVPPPRQHASGLLWD